MYKIELDPLYELELEQILISIITDYTLDYAEKVVSKIDESIERIKEFPKMYAVYADVPMYRKFTVEQKYTIFYTVNDNEQLVRIVHIFPSIRDLPSLLS